METNEKLEKIKKEKLEKLSSKLKFYRQRELDRFKRYEKLAELTKYVFECKNNNIDCSVAELEIQKYSDNQYHWTESPYRLKNLFNEEYHPDLEWIDPNDHSKGRKDGFQWLAEMVSKPGWFDLFVGLIDIWSHNSESFHEYVFPTEIRELDEKLNDLEPYLHLLPKELTAYSNCL